MTSVIFAAFVLFNGHNLEGWKILSGDWDGPRRCHQCVRSTARSGPHSSPISIRISSEYHAPGQGENTLVTLARLDGTGGEEIPLRRNNRLRR